MPRAARAELAEPADPRVAVLADLVNRHSAERRALMERARVQRAELERLGETSAMLALELGEARAAASPPGRGAVRRVVSAAAGGARAIRRRAARPEPPSVGPKPPATGGRGAVLNGTVGRAEGAAPLLAGNSPATFRRGLLALLDAPDGTGLRIARADALAAGDPELPLPRPEEGWPDVLVMDAPEPDIRRLPRQVLVVARVGAAVEPWLAAPWFDSVDVVVAGTAEAAAAVRAGSSKAVTLDASSGPVAGPQPPDSAGVLRAIRAWAEAVRFGILVQAPTWEAAETSGDYHFARGLQRALERRGHPATVYLQRQWELPVTSREDAILHLWGRYEVATRPSQVRALWILYHPELVTPALLDRYDRVFAGSSILAGRLAPLTSVPVEALHQATDPERLVPRVPAPHHELLFIGNSRGTRRTIIDDLGPTARDLAVYGMGWEPELLDPRYLQPETVAHADVGSHYAAAGIVLNDHWPEAADAGLITNRLYDILAAGGFALTDPVSGLAEEFDGGVATYSSPADLALEVERFLADPGIRAAMTARGRAAVLARHTFGARVDRLLEVLLPLVGATGA